MQQYSIAGISAARHSIELSTRCARTAGVNWEAHIEAHRVLTKEFAANAMMKHVVSTGLQRSHSFQVSLTFSFAVTLYTGDGTDR